jgi:hypothetical protein
MWFNVCVPIPKKTQLKWCSDGTIELWCLGIGHFFGCFTIPQGGGSGTLSIGATSPEMYQNVGWLFVARAILYVFWYVRFTTRKPWFRGNTSFFLSKRKFVYEMGENSVHAQEPGVDLYVLCKRKAMSQATKRWHLVTSKWPLLGRQKMDIKLVVPWPNGRRPTWQGLQYWCRKNVVFSQ